MSDRQTLIPSMSFRWVDKSTCPQAWNEKVLQQYFTVAETGRGKWVDVPFAGHINEVQP